MAAYAIIIMKLFKNEYYDYKFETLKVVTYEEAKEYADFHKCFFQDKSREQSFPEAFTLTDFQRRLFSKHFKYAFGKFAIKTNPRHDDYEDVLMWQFSHGFGGEGCIMFYDWADGDMLTATPKHPSVFNQHKRRLKALLPIYIEESLLRQGLTLEE